MIIVDYFYTDANGEKQGPIKEQQLRKLAAQGVIRPDTPLETTSGHKGSAKQIPGIRFNTAAVNPFAVTEQSALTKQAEQARLEAETSTIVAEVAAYNLRHHAISVTELPGRAAVAITVRFLLSCGSTCPLSYNYVVIMQEFYNIIFGITYVPR